ncbi:MAG TPA: YegP family protein [Cyclobacteriaceae bacterium]|nr:YegP family protein [Cyclobacteriaceae bacterium]
MGKFLVSKRANDEFQFNLVADNNEIILTSEGYASRSGCENGIASVKENALRDEAFDRGTSTNGKSYFNMKAKNFQIIGTSQMYESPSAMEKGIESVMKNAPSASIFG